MFHNVYRSYYCKVVFALSLVAAYFLIPNKIFSGYYSVLGVGFMISFSLVTTCLVKDIKEKIIIEKNKYKGHLLGLAFSVIGLTALHTCSVGAPVCGAAVGFGLLSLTPSLLAGFMTKYAVAIVIFSVIVQLITMYYMNCFKE